MTMSLLAPGMLAHHPPRLSCRAGVPRRMNRMRAHRRMMPCPQCGSLIRKRWKLSSGLLTMLLLPCPLVCLAARLPVSASGLRMGGSGHESIGGFRHLVTATAKRPPIGTWGLVVPGSSGAAALCVGTARSMEAMAATIELMWGEVSMGLSCVNIAVLSACSSCSGVILTMSRGSPPSARIPSQQALHRPPAVVFGRCLENLCL